MELVSIRRTTAVDAVYEQLLARILDGSLAPGDPLPGERELAEQLDVNRQVVREARRRLDQDGLLQVRHGRRTLVRDPRRFGGPELLARWVVAGDDVDAEVVLDVLEARVVVGAEVVALAARRATPSARAEVADLAEAVADRLARAHLEGEPLQVDAVTAAALAALDRRWWDVLAEASGNLALRSLASSLGAAVDAVRGRRADLLVGELVDVTSRRAVADAVVAGDAGRAADASRRLLGRGRGAAAEVLARR